MDSEAHIASGLYQRRGVQTLFRVQKFGDRFAAVSSPFVCDRVILPGADILDGDGNRMTQFFCRPRGPVRVAQQFAGKEYHIRLPRAKDMVCLVG